MKIRLLIITLACCLQGYAVCAQESPVLEAYLREGLTSNLALQQEQLEVNKAIQALRQAKALFAPQITFAPTYSLAYGGRRIAVPVGDMLNPLFATINELTGRQDFPTDIPNVDELLAPHNYHDTKITFQIPLYSPELKYNYLIHSNMLSSREARLKVVSTEISFAIREAYYQYMQALKLQEVYRSSRKILEELTRLNQRLLDNQMVTRDLVLASEYELSAHDRQMAEMEKNVNVTQAYFNFLLNRDLSSDIKLDTHLLQKAGHLQIQEDLDQLIAEALSGRQEIKTLDFSVLAARNATQLESKSAVWPNLYIGGNTGFQGYSYRFANQGYLIAQVGLRWDLYKGGERKAKIAQAQIREQSIELQRTEAEKRVMLEVVQAYHALKASFQGLKEAEVGLEKARAYYRITHSRYFNQNVLLVEYMKAVEDLKKAEILHTISQYELLLRKAHLDRVVGRSLVE